MNEIDNLVLSLKDNVEEKQGLILTLNTEIVRCRELLRKAMAVIQVYLPRSEDTRKITREIHDYLEE